MKTTTKQNRGKNEMQTTHKLLAILAMVAAIAWTSSEATVITLSGPGVTDDNGLFFATSTPAYAGYNYGAGANSAGPGLTSGTERRDLLRFDLSSLAGQTVLSASLQLTKQSTEGSSYFNAAVNLYQIFPTNAGWVEGTANFVPQAGSSDWNYAIDNTLPWRNSAGTGNFPGLGSPGDSYQATPAGSFLVSWNDLDNTTVETVTFSNVSFIQNWIDNPAQNAGFLVASPDLVAAGGVWRYWTADAGTSTSTYWPVLTLELAIPEPSSLGLLAIGGLLVWRRAKRKDPLSNADQAPTKS